MRRTREKSKRPEMEDFSQDDAEELDTELSIADLSEDEDEEFIYVHGGRGPSKRMRIKETHEVSKREVPAIQTYERIMEHVGASIHLSREEEEEERAPSVDRITGTPPPPPPVSFYIPPPPPLIPAPYPYAPSYPPRATPPSTTVTSLPYRSGRAGEEEEERETTTTRSDTSSMTRSRSSVHAGNVPISGTSTTVPPSVSALPRRSDLPLLNEPVSSLAASFFSPSSSSSSQERVLAPVGRPVRPATHKVGLESISRAFKNVAYNKRKTLDYMFISIQDMFYFINGAILRIPYILQGSIPTASIGGIVIKNALLLGLIKRINYSPPGCIIATTKYHGFGLTVRNVLFEVSELNMVNKKDIVDSPDLPRFYRYTSHGTVEFKSEMNEVHFELYKRGLLRPNQTFTATNMYGTRNNMIYALPARVYIAGFFLSERLLLVSYLNDVGQNIISLVELPRMNHVWDINVGVMLLETATLYNRTGRETDAHLYFCVRHPVSDLLTVFMVHHNGTTPLGAYKYQATWKVPSPSSVVQSRVIYMCAHGRSLIMILGGLVGGSFIEPVYMATHMVVYDGISTKSVISALPMPITTPITEIFDNGDGAFRIGNHYVKPIPPNFSAI